MSLRFAGDRSVASPIDAYRCTGTSPGLRAARTHVSHDAEPIPVLETPYERHGPNDGLLTVVLGGISADHHLAPTPSDPTEGWWPGVCGIGHALDPTREGLLGFHYFVPDAAAEVRTSDQAAVLLGLLDRLGVDRVRLVGASYGGMVALAFAAAYPHRTDSLVVIGAAHRPHPMATALRVLQRRIAADDLGLARALAMTTYRSALEFEERFDWRPSREHGFEVTAYLDARGDDFRGRFDVERYRVLSESIDLHAIDPARLVSPTTLVSFDTDQIAPPWLVQQLADEAPGVVVHETIPSIYGHDAFLKEVDAVGRVLRDAAAGRAVR